MTKRVLFSFLVLCFAISSTSAAMFSAAKSAPLKADRLMISASAIADVDLNGKWNLTVSLPNQALTVTLDLTQSDQTFTGKMTSAMGDGNVSNGTIKENEFSAVVQATIQGQPMDIQMNGKYEADKITGTLSIPNAEAFPFEGTKVKAE